MPAFDSQQYGPAVATLLADDRLGALDAGSPNPAALAELRALAPESLFDRPVIDADMARACLAGLWLWHDYLTESHELSQTIDTPTGSFWHGIMHRREGDFGNAKYWFRRVGKHPVFPPLAAAADDKIAASGAESSQMRLLTAAGNWDPLLFIDLCEAARGESDIMLLRRIARREWQVLFDYCYREAVGA